MSITDLWIIASAIFGAIIGSFLNVVIYRMPRGLSISRPRWSYCPNCRNRIPFRHNVPVLGWLWLRGRCGMCSKPIDVIYPLIELATALLFLLVADSLFVGKMLPLIGQPQTDWAIAAAHFTLFAALLATAAMDIESYMVDVRVLLFSMVVGVIGIGLWFVFADPTSSSGGAGSFAVPMHFQPAGMPHTDTRNAVTGLLAPTFAVIGGVMGVVWWLGERVRVRVLGGRPPGGDEESDGESDVIESGDSPASASPEPPARWPAFLAVGVMSVLAAGLLVWILRGPDQGLEVSASPALQRGLLGLAIFMSLLVASMTVHRESDQQIVDEIESERHGARRVALRELMGLLPAALVGLGLFFYWRIRGQLGADWGDLLGSEFQSAWYLRLLAGLGTSFGALVWSAAVGWFVRIAGTLGFGREAFGTGDIYIMAAIGAVLGVWGLVFSFFLAAILALLGVVATLFWKSSRALPFGPWLGLGAFATMWLMAPLLKVFGPAGGMLWSLLTGRLVE